MKLNALNLLAALAVFAPLTPSVQAQGTLNPPAGMPVPVMKSLDQIEARTPVNTLPGDTTAAYVISQPGSYYLTGNLAGESGKAGIRIEAANVTLDLNGFALAAPAGATVGINITAISGQFSIGNGQLNFWPQGGISCTSAASGSIENLKITSAGGPGITLAGISTVRQVQIKGATTHGIRAKGSVISDCLVENITAPQAGTAVYGIHAEAGTVLACAVRNLTGNGALTIGIATSVARDCVVESVQTVGSHASGIYAVVINTNNSAVMTGSAENCRVRGVYSTGMASGIYFFGTVSGSSVDEIIASTVTGLAYGACGVAVQATSVSNIKASGGQAIGISAIGVTDSHVYAVQNTGGNATGILLDDGTGASRGGSARNCTVRGAKDYGIFTLTGGTVSGCSVAGLATPYLPTAKGFYAYGQANIVENNSATSCGTGFYATSGNLFKGNLAADNTINYQSVPAVITSVSSATNSFANLSL